MIANNSIQTGIPGLSVSSESVDSRLLFIKYMKDTDSVTISGWSIHDDIPTYYETLMNETQSHLELRSGLVCNIQLELFNASTVKYLFKFIKIFNQNSARGKDVKINWVVKNKDQDMIDTGLDLKEFCDFEFDVTNYDGDYVSTGTYAIA
ncbi:MAG: SiaC family regulatory phosphoprotein [Cyclobacteriaceae bacterium]